MANRRAHELAGEAYERFRDALIAELAELPDNVPAAELEAAIGAWRPSAAQPEHR